MKKRLIAFLLVLIMVLGMLPVSAFAVDGDATKYTYTLYYKWNNGTDSTWSTEVTDRPTAATTFTSYVNGAKLTRDGYTFLGWADTADATTASYKGGDPIVLDKDNPTKTIYAVWEKNVAPIEYTVTYYKNDGSANDVFYKTPDWGRPSEQFNIYWEKPTRDGYDFVGWAETRNATEAKYASGGAGGKQSWIKLDGPKVLYAVWQEAGFEPEAPRSPSDCKDQLKTNTIKLVCVDGNHPDKVITFADVSYGSDWSMGDTCKLNFYAKDAALKYPGHAPKNPEERIYVTFKWVNNETDANGKYLPGKWVMDETTAAVVKLVDTGVEAPSKPTTAQLGNIKVTCRTNAEHSSEFPVAKCMGTTVGTVTFDSVKKQWYIDTAPMTTQLASRYDSWKSYAEGTHRLVNPDAELNARFYYDGEKWYTEDTLAIDVCCGAVSEIPGKPDMNQFLGNVLIRCTTDGSTHAEKGRKNIYSNTRDSSMYTEVLDGNGDAIWKDNGGVWTYQIKLIRAKFVEAYSNNQFIKYAHTDTAPNEETILTWKYKNGAWELIKLPGYTEVAAIIEVKCAETPVKPDKPTALDGSFAIVCKNNKATHAYKADYIATPSQYTISDVQKDEQGYYVTATVTVAPNLAEYNARTGAEHRLVNEQDATLTITFRYDTEATGKWTQQGKQQGKLPVVEVTCKGIEEPTRDDIFKALNGPVTVTCINRFWKDGNNNMDCGQGQYAAKAGIVGQEYALAKGENDTTWVVTFPVTNFVKSFKQNPAHNLYTKDTLSWYIRWENNAWTSAPVEPGVDDLVKLTHAPTDWREVAKIATGGKSDCIHVSCVNGETGVCDYGITVPFVYSATDVVSVEPEDGVPGSYIATFKVDRYIDTCAKACNDKNFPDAPRTHKLLTQETVQWRLYATSEADEKIGNNVLNHVWAADPVTPGTDDVCEIAHNWVVTFDPNGGTPVPLAQEVEYGHTATKPVEPTLKGYTFDGWYLDEAEAPFSFDTTITSDITLKAKWTQNTYTVTFDANGGEGTMDDQTFTYDEEKALTTNAFTRTGYTFTGWNTAADGTGEAFADKATVKNLTAEPNGAVTLYAQWEAKNDTPYKVKYYIEKLDGTYDYNDSYEGRGTTDTRIDATKVHNKSYENFTLDLNHPDTVQFGNIAGDGSLVLKLFYTRNTYDYTVRHIKQLPDGSYDEANAEVETLSGKFEALAAVTAKDYGSHYPTNDADTKQNIKIEKGLTIDVKYDLDEHTLTFETNGGSAINPVTVRHGNAVARPADPTKDKYTFIGWYADPEFTEEYDFATVLEADKTIYAKFELTSTPIGDIYVRYDVLHIKQLPDGTYDLANAEVEHLSAKKDSTVTAVIKDYRATHHVNVNRTLSKLTGTAIQPYMGVDGKPVYTILSVYYDLDFHTLTFDTMGGSKIAPETVRHGLTVAKPKDPVNGGYIFDGWYTDKTFRHRYDFSTPLTEDITIYAKWFLIVLPGVTVKKNTPKLNTADHFAYVQGYPDGTVKPAGNITRAETAAILFRLMDDASRKTYYSTKSGFRDVASGSWYNTYVATLNNAGVITDSSNGYFRPNEAITRAELAAMLAKFSETTGAANYFNDVSAKYWAANAIAICAKLGWITGYPDGTFRPDKNVTRAELMAMINRATGRAPKSADAFLPGMKTWIDNTSDKWYYLDVQEATNSHSYTVKGSETWTALTSDPNWSLYE